MQWCLSNQVTGAFLRRKKGSKSVDLYWGLTITLWVLCLGKIFQNHCWFNHSGPRFCLCQSSHFEEVVVYSLVPTMSKNEWKGGVRRFLCISFFFGFNNPPIVLVNRRLIWWYSLHLSPVTALKCPQPGSQIKHYVKRQSLSEVAEVARVPAIWSHLWR